MEKDEKLRLFAIRRRLLGESVQLICHDLKVSKKWFYKWFARYQTGDAEWYKNHSRTPKNIPQKTDKKLEELVVQIRDKLSNTPYAQIGAVTIAWHIQSLGIEPPPYWTINRILKRNDRIKPKKKYTNKSNIQYPYFTEAFYPGHLHQADLLGPRYIKSDGRFYLFSEIDCFSHQVFSVANRSKDDESIVKTLIKIWQEIGVPEFLQFDNELTFHGSHRHPHTLGRVLQLCLSVGIQPIFIPIGEPWRNGVIERFNRTLEKSFYRTERFENFIHLQKKLQYFLNFHYENYVYSTNLGKTPKQLLDNEEIKPEKLSENFQFIENCTLPYESYIHVIRFIRSDLKLRIWTETFIMPKEAMYQYVRATIFTEFHLLNVFLENKLIAQFEYLLPNFNQEEAPN